MMPGMTPITAADVQAMVTHWLGCPPNGYLGTGYGSGVQDLLQTALHGGGADDLVAKMRQDIPVLNMLPPEAISISFQPDGAERLQFFIQVADAVIPIDIPGAAALA